MIEGVLIEKNAEIVKKELDTQIINIKQTLDIVQKTMKTQEATLKEWERKYSSLLGAQKKGNNNATSETGTNKGGVLA